MVICDGIGVHLPLLLWAVALASDEDGGEAGVREGGWQGGVRASVAGISGGAAHTDELRKTTYRLLVDDIVKDEGGVDFGDDVAVDLLGPRNGAGRVELEGGKVQLEKGDGVGDAVDEQADAGGV